MGHEFGDDHGTNVGTDLARRAPARPDALTPTLAPRVARSLARFYYAKNFNQALDNWDTSKVTTMKEMWVLTSPTVRSPRRAHAHARSARRSLARQVPRSHCLQPAPQWLGHEQGDDHVGHVGTDLARRAPARPDALSPAVRPPAPTRSRSRSLRAPLARSPGSATPRTSTRTSAAGS